MSLAGAKSVASCALMICCKMQVFQTPFMVCLFYWNRALGTVYTVFLFPVPGDGGGLDTQVDARTYQQCFASTVT
eukprot:5577681-Amphidinium_carterae.1